ncbi:hypothetical protein [Armatimonas sp.]
MFLLKLKGRANCISRAEANFEAKNLSIRVANAKAPKKLDIIAVFT